MNPDFQEAESFLTLLDPKAKFFTFQTFDDDSERKDPSLASIRHAPFAKCKDWLADMNRRGAGIFVCVNETDGKGRKSGNIIRIRATWQEDDKGWRGDFPIPPSLEVATSPGKFHRYWFLRPGERLTCKQFKGVMRCMVERYGSDPQACDIARVLRLPGFFNRKYEKEFLSNIILGTVH